MARLAPRLERFDRDFEFVANKPLLVNGVPVAVGQPIDKSKFTTRRLRQLYEWRYIRRVELPVKVIITDIVAPKKRGRPKKIAA